MHWWWQGVDVTDEVDDDGDLEGGGWLHVGDVAGVGQTRFGGVTQTVAIVSDRAPGAVALAISGRINWNMNTFADR